MTTQEYETFIDAIEALERANYEGCGPNVGPEEFDECASRASRALRVLRTCEVQPRHRDRLLVAKRIASDVFRGYVRV